MGTPGRIPSADREPVDDTGLARLRAFVEAGWEEFDRVAERAAGRTLARGPRGGVRWKPRYFVRRVVWHALDHAWEIEDRS